MRFWIDVENAAGTRQGSGPITAALNWRSTRRLDRAGEFSFEMPATDSRASLVTARRVARCKAVINGAVVEVGAGIIDTIATRVGEDGLPMLVVSGPDLLSELRRVVLDKRTDWADFDQLDDIPYSLIFTWANAKLPVASAWALADEAGTAIGSGAAVTATDIYAKFRHESVLAGLIGVAQSAGEHFRLGTGRTVEWVNSWSDCGVRAVYGAPSPVAVEAQTGIAAIGSIERVQDSADIVNRVFLFGSGEGFGRVDLGAMDTWPDGTAIGGGLGPYTRTIDGVALRLSRLTGATETDFGFNCLQDDGSDSTYGVNEMALAFKNITPISNTAADVTAAANQLLRSGFHWLKTRSQPQDFYRLSLVGVQGMLKPGTSIVVVARRYVDGVAAVNINTTLYILEATTEVGVDGLRTTDLLVSTTTRQPDSDAGVLVERMSEAVVSQAHQQTGPNSYTENHVAWMDKSKSADFYFWLGEDIAQVQQVLLRFRVDPLRSTVTAAASGGSSAPTSEDGGASTETAAATGGNHVHTIQLVNEAAGSAVTYNSGGHYLVVSGGGYFVSDAYNLNHDHSVDIPDHTHVVNLPDHTHTMTYGIFEETSANTFGHTAGAASVAQIQSDIDILVGGVDRSASIVAESTAGWFKLDVTSWLIDATTLRPSAAANVIEFSDPTAAAAKTAQITFKLQVRCTVQAVNYT